MTNESRGFKLVLGGAVLTFLLTVVTFVSSVATVRAVDCNSDGFYGIGPNCWDECWGGGYPWQNCAQCASYFCNELADPGEPYPFDEQCAQSCFEGATTFGCTETNPFTCN